MTQEKQITPEEKWLKSISTPDETIYDHHDRPSNLSHLLKEYAEAYHANQLATARGFMVPKGDEVNAILSASLRLLNQEQLICLRDNLIERTPKDVLVIRRDMVPSDEEIGRKAIDTTSDYVAYSRGAKWMRDKLLGQHTDNQEGQ